MFKYVPLGFVGKGKSTRSLPPLIIQILEVRLNPIVTGGDIRQPGFLRCLRSSIQLINLFLLLLPKECLQLPYYPALILQFSVQPCDLLLYLILLFKGILEGVNFLSELLILFGECLDYSGGFLNCHVLQSFLLYQSLDDVLLLCAMTHYAALTHTHCYNNN